MASGLRGGYGVARQIRHYGSRGAFETRVDYVEGNLEKAIARLDSTIVRLDSRFEESRKEFKESINESRKEFKEAMQEMEIRHQAAVEKSEARTTEMLKDSRSARNWTIATCIAILTLAATIASGIVGQILTEIAGN